MKKLESVSMSAEQTVSKVANASLTTIAVPGAVLKGIRAGLKSVAEERKQARAAKKATELEAELTV